MNLEDDCRVARGKIIMDKRGNAQRRKMGKESEGRPVGSRPRTRACGPGNEHMLVPQGVWECDGSRLPSSGRRGC